MVRPLLLASSKLPITGPAAGHVQFTSSSGSRAGGFAGGGVAAATGGRAPTAGGVCGAADALAPGVTAPLGTDDAAAGAGLASSGRVSTRPVLTPRGAVAAASVPGGVTRITCPTSSELGFSM